jgi:hypothetical protein
VLDVVEVEQHVVGRCQGEVDLLDLGVLIVE